MAFGKKNEVKIDPLKYNIALLGESGIGKEQPVSEPVLTEYGWELMGDIKVGIKVYGRDGKLHNVTGVYPQGVKDIYKVTFSDGTSTRCGLEHLWTVSTKKQKETSRQNNEERTMTITLKEILKDYKKFVIDPMNKNGGYYSFKYSVPINKCIEFENRKELQLNPYVLGLLLGDGGFTGNMITFTNSEDELFQRLEEKIKLYNCYLSYRDFSNHKQCTICSNESRNKLTNAIRELGLYGCDSREKYIPKEYIFTSKENRLDLLSGLINTDGSVSKNGEIITISTYSNQLAKDIAELARSLGYVSHIGEYDRTNESSTKKYDSEIEYHISIISDDYSDLSLSKKHEEKLMNKRISYVKSIQNIEYVGQEEAQCIMLDGDEHLYITKDYIVTHNTTIIKEMCEKLGGEDSYIFLEMNGEAGADAIQGIVYEDVDDWDMVEEIVSDIEDNKSTEYKSLKVVVVDTYDGWINLAQNEAIRLWNKAHPDKRADSIDSSWNGFQKGQQKAFDLMFDIIKRLRAVGVATIIIGHVKNREITDVASGITYQQLTSDVEKVYFNLLKKKMHFVGLAYFDRTIITEKTGKKNIVTKKEETINRITDETRKIRFRDPALAVDSKSRFADIVAEIDFNVDDFIKAMKDAIQKEASKGNKSIEELEEEQTKREKEEFERIAKVEKDTKAQKEVDFIIEEIVSYMTENKSDLDKIRPVMAKVKELGYDNPTKITSIEDAKSVLAVTLL